MNSLSPASLLDLVTGDSRTALAPKDFEESFSLKGCKWVLSYSAQERRYMFTRKVFLLFGLLLFTGCATAYRMAPLKTEHPAHPQAMVAPELPPSRTLAYKPADIPSTIPASESRITQREARRSRPSGGNGQETVVGEGKVIAVVQSSGQLVVDHKEIKGFMEAMTMGYRVDPVSLLEGLNAGDMIRFTINSQKKAIIKIDKIKK